MSNSTPHKAVLIICGPTASGKTALAVQLADCFDLEVVSADSRQVYRGMDIGTAKPTVMEQACVKHHLIDVARPDEAFDASRYAALAAQAVDQILESGKRAALVGGTGLYIRALTEGLAQVPGADPAIRRRLHALAEQQGSAALHVQLQAVDPVAASRLHANDLVRIVRALEVYELTGRTISAIQQEHGFADQPYRTLKLGLALDRDELFARINQRAVAMFEQGLLEEVAGLLAAGYRPDLKAMQTIGYRQAIAVLHGEMTLAAAIDDLQKATRRYAKQQITWFRQDNSIIWVDSSTDFATIRKLIDDFYGS